MKVSTATCALPKRIIDTDPEDTDNNNAVNVVNHNSFASTAAATDSTPASSPAKDSSTAVETEEQEYSYFGFKVGAKLKWVNIIGIVVIHALFVYTFTHNPLLPRIYTYMWGECECNDDDVDAFVWPVFVCAIVPSNKNMHVHWKK